jgi:hypothetical protein
LGGENTEDVFYLLFKPDFVGTENIFFNLERRQKVIKLYGKFLVLAAMICSTIAFTNCSTAPSSNNGNVVVTNSNANSTTKPAGDTTKTETATTSGDKVGVPECDEYIEKMETCFTKVPEAQRAMVKTNFDTMRKSWKEAASTPQGKAGLATGCKAALDAAKQSYSYCAW